MTISIFDLFSIGIGPSSSHTVGPMRAAKQFMLSAQQDLNNIHRVEVTLFGSLAYTGEGHGTHKALIMGLCGEDPETVAPDSIDTRVQHIYDNKQINLLDQHNIAFDPLKEIIANTEFQYDYHSNAMQFTAFDTNNKIVKQEVYYSIGGGFIINDTQRNNLTEHRKSTHSDIPFQFDSAAELLAHCKQNKCHIYDIMLENEKTWRTEQEIRSGLLHISDIMLQCIQSGCEASGSLQGGLNVQRRAPHLYQLLKSKGEIVSSNPLVMNWLNCWAMAVNEENAAGGRVVTAPTNGAAGIIPAVLKHFITFHPGDHHTGVINFLLTAGAIGILYKKNASISGAEMGCQGEVGVACSMAAGGLVAAWGGTIYQAENAAEIAMEHNLGLTCDPVGGLVQIPCIERNAMGAVKSVNAAQLAIAESGSHKVSLDMVINTMREIGTNMNSIYKETSQGGLAVNVPEC